jgi:hypothetical protein
MGILTAIFIFSTWGLGLLSWIVFMSYRTDKWDLEVKSLKQELQQKDLFLSKIESLQPLVAGGRIPSDVAKEIPEKIKELMKSSPDHPEVDEIDGSDVILGIRFEAENYPPGFGETDEE